MTPSTPAFRNALPVTAILVLLFGTQPVAMDLYLPALPEIAGRFGGRMGQAQWTLTAYLLAFGISQLFVGALSDRFGRRKTLLCGLACYIAAAAIGALAPSLGVLVASRALLGAATAACVTSARAVIRDCYSGQDGMGIMARSMTGMSAIALVSPVIGGVATSLLGWTSTIAMIAVFGVAAWIAVYTTFTETATTTGGSARIGIGVLLCHPQFLASSFLAGCSFSGAVSFLLLSPFIFIGKFGMSRIAYGLVPAICSLAFLSGTVFCRHYLARVPVPEVIRLAAMLSVAGGIGQLLLWHAGILTPWSILASQCLYMFGHGIHQPCGQAGSVAPFPQFAGRAAAVSGFIIIATAFAVGQAVSHSSLPPAQTLMTVLALAACAIACLGWLAIPRAYRLAEAGQARAAMCSDNS
ncbi:MFS transporter [Noviherbaspirillum denitrificans]|uniref:Major facilitator superfamily (MFS) profile domain-containing protein n=1 Tax=Noviherbaspirillum denitrificans TaxID=1968433 RepID=A0A254TA76_9BURK|nr:MFS transporter [Noviherbaspirillum denitrificans]OWW19550.1 hypothetical protein AYR66_08500 [Noviherbaspirillum denitrificans]